MQSSVPQVSSNNIAKCSLRSGQIHPNETLGNPLVAGRVIFTQPTATQVKSCHGRLANCFFQMGKWKSDWGQTHNIRNQHATNCALSDGQQMPELLVSEHRQRLPQEWYRVPRSKHTFQNSRPQIWRVLALIPAQSFISSQVPVFLSIHVTGPTFVREICFGGTQLRPAKSIKLG